MSEIFIPRMPLEMVVRGTATFWFLFAIFRFVIRRRVGAVGMADLLVLVIVSDAIQNSMAGEYTSVTDGFILVATLVAWTIFTDWLAYRFPQLEKLLQPPPLLLIRGGKVLHRNLRQEFVSETELQAKLRENGVMDYAEVEAAFMESDGEISVVKRRGSRASSS